MSLYDSLKGYGNYYSDPLGTGAVSPALDTGSFIDPMKTATSTAADVAATGATGPWGTDSNLSLNKWAPINPLDTNNSKGWGDSGGNKSKSGIGWNLGTLDVVLGGLQTLAGIWQSWEANKLAKKQLEMQRGLANINIANQSSAYNLSLKDRVTNRVESGGWDPGRGADFLKQYSLPTRTV